MSFFNLPLEIQAQIFRYLPLKQKYDLLAYNEFHDVLTDKYSWGPSLKVSPKILPACFDSLLQWIEPGTYVSRKSVFMIEMNYNHAAAKILEYNNKAKLRKKRCERKLKHSVAKTLTYLKNFYIHNTKLDTNDKVFETWNRELLIFNDYYRTLNFDRRHLLNLRSCNERNMYHTRFRNISLLYKENTLTIIFVTFIEEEYSPVCRCKYLNAASSMGNEEFRYRYPEAKSELTIVKAFPVDSMFKCTRTMEMTYRPKGKKVLMQYHQQYTLSPRCIEYRTIKNLLSESLD